MRSVGTWARICASGIITDVHDRRFRVLLVIVLVGGGALACLTVWRPRLRALGRALAIDDPIATIDIVAVRCGRARLARSKPPTWSMQGSAGKRRRTGEPYPGGTRDDAAGHCPPPRGRPDDALLLSLGIEAVERFPGAARTAPNPRASCSRAGVTPTRFGH